MNIRKLIREEIKKVIFEDETGMSPILGSTLDDITGQLTGDLTNVGTIISTQKIDLQNKDNEIKTDLQLKSKLDANNPHKKGLDREIPEKQKDYEARKKQLKDLETAQKGMEAAKEKIAKQSLDLEKQSAQSNTSTTSNNTTPSVLPSLGSLI